MNYLPTLPLGMAGRANKRLLNAALGVALGALALASTGCMARAGVSGGVMYEEPVVEVEPEPVEVQLVPVEVERYPTYVYAGSNVYLVDGRWYRRHGERWVVYRAEPRALASVRVTYESKYGRNYRPKRREAPPPARHPARPRHTEHRGRGDRPDRR